MCNFLWYFSGFTTIVVANEGLEKPGASRARPPGPTALHPLRRMWWNTSFSGVELSGLQCNGVTPRSEEKNALILVGLELTTPGREAQVLTKCPPVIAVCIFPWNTTTCTHHFHDDKNVILLLSFSWGALFHIGVFDFDCCPSGNKWTRATMEQLWIVFKGNSMSLWVTKSKVSLLLFMFSYIFTQ